MQNRHEKLGIPQTAEEVAKQVADFFSENYKELLSCEPLIFGSRVLIQMKTGEKFVVETRRIA